MTNEWAVRHTDIPRGLPTEGSRAAVTHQTFPRSLVAALLGTTVVSALLIRHWNFGHSSLIRHSGLVIRHSEGPDLLRVRGRGLAVRVEHARDLPAVLGRELH